MNPAAAGAVAPLIESLAIQDFNALLRTAGRPRNRS